MKLSAAEIDSLLFAEQGSNPATPASGFGRLFIKADGLYFIDDAGTVTGPLGGGGGGGITGLDAVSASYSAGNITVNSANWAEVAAASGGPGTGGLDLTLTGVTAGDKVIYGVSGLWGNQSPQTHMDVVTVVSSTVTNSFAEGGAAVTAPGKSITGWAAVSAAFHNIGGTSKPYTTVAGDLSSGSLKLRLRYGQTGGSGSRTLYASSTLPLDVWAINLGQ